MITVRLGNNQAFKVVSAARAKHLPGCLQCGQSGFRRAEPKLQFRPLLVGDVAGEPGLAVLDFALKSLAAVKVT